MINNKIMYVYYGEDCLPYKDIERQVHYPIVGGTFAGASETTEIRFFVDRLATNQGNNISWVAHAIRADGTFGYQILEFNNVGGYAPLVLSQWYCEKQGDLRISLYGYAGGVEVETDSETGLMTVSGDPIVQATGVIKLSVNYAVQMSSDYGTQPTISVQEALALLGEKADESYVDSELAKKLNITDSIPLMTIDLEDMVDYTTYKFVDFYDYYIKGQDIDTFGNMDGKPIAIRFIHDTNDFGLNGTYIGFVVKDTENSAFHFNFVKIEPDWVINGEIVDGGETLLIGGTTSISTTETIQDIFYGSTYSRGYAVGLKDLATKVSKSSTPNIVYGTREIGISGVAQEHSYPLRSVYSSLAVARWDADGNISVKTPTQNSHPATKNYVDINDIKSIDFSVDSNYVLSLALKNGSGTTIATGNVDLPLESIVVSATYYDEYTYGGTTYEKVIVIVLATTDVPTIIPVGDITEGLIDEDTLNQALSNYIPFEIDPRLTIAQLYTKYGNYKHFFGLYYGEDFSIIVIEKSGNNYYTTIEYEGGYITYICDGTETLLNIKTNGEVEETIRLDNGINVVSNSGTFDNEHLLSIKEYNAYLLYNASGKSTVLHLLNHTSSVAHFASLPELNSTDNTWEYKLAEVNLTTGAYSITTETMTYSKGQIDTLLGGKQNTLTFDNTPTANSDNPVKSGGIKTYVDNAIQEAKAEAYIEVDTTEYPTLQDFLTDYDGVAGSSYLYPIDTTDLTKGYYKYIWENNDWFSMGRTTDVDLYNYPAKNANETITGSWTFSNGIVVGNVASGWGEQVKFNNNVAVYNETNNLILKATSSVISMATIRPYYGTEDIGTSGVRWKNLYLGGAINPNSSTYGLTLPDTTSFTANKEIATTDTFGFKVIPAPSSTTLSDDEIAQFRKGVIFEGTFLGLSGLFKFNPCIASPTNYEGTLEFTRNNYQQTRFYNYSINASTKVISLHQSTDCIYLLAAGDMSINRLVSLNNKTVPAYPANNSGTYHLTFSGTAVSWTQDWYGTQTQYDNLGTYDSNTTYYILES